MIAEIHHKISSSGSNLTDRLEDKLTGDVFGHLRYLPYEIGLKSVLSACYFPVEQKVLFDMELENSMHFDYKFWPRYNEGEPDLILESDNALILIEVKYNSGLSNGVEEEGNEDEAPEISRNQLARESCILKQIKGNKKAFLIFLARKGEAASIYNQTVEQKLIESEVAFGYLSWTAVCEVLKVLKLNIGICFPNNLIVDDILLLLQNKGFERFNKFDSSHQNISTKAFTFNKIQKHKFSFQTNQSVKTNYYEYR